MPVGATKLAEDSKLAEDLLNLHGLPVAYVRQGYLSLSDPTKTLHELIIARKIRHGGHPILRWHASNAVVRKDPAGNIKLDKGKSRKKIDGMAALVNAIGAAIAHPDDTVHEHPGLRWL
jgi:phage terminase large subunit-like protein